STGVCDPAESCDGVSNDCPADVVEPDDDHDGLCNDVDPCTNGALAKKPKLKLGKLLPPSGDENFKLSGVVTLPTTPTIDPIGRGLRVLITDAHGGTVFDETLPGGGFDPLAGVGWKANKAGTAWTYINKGGFTVTTKAALKGTTATPGLYTFQVKGK